MSSCDCEMQRYLIFEVLKVCHRFSEVHSEVRFPVGSLPILNFGSWDPNPLQEILVDEEIRLFLSDVISRRGTRP